MHHDYPYNTTHSASRQSDHSAVGTIDHDEWNSLLVVIKTQHYMRTEKEALIQACPVRITSSTIKNGFCQEPSH